METKDASSLTNSSVSDLDKTMPKKPFRISSKVSVGLSTEDKKQSRQIVRDQKPQNQINRLRPVPTGQYAVKSLLNNFEDNPEEISSSSLLAGSILAGRVKEDLKEYESFLDRLGLMQYYDRLWEIGVDSLDGLAKVTVEDYNHLFVPAGSQIKIQRELKKIGRGADPGTKEMAIDTEDLSEGASELKKIPQPATGKLQSRLNFGVKMKATPAPVQVTTCSMAIETDPVDDHDMPLNVNEDKDLSSDISSLQHPVNTRDQMNCSVQTEPLPCLEEPSQQEEPAKPEQGFAFSFANIGGSEWTNCFGGNTGTQFSMEPVQRKPREERAIASKLVSMSTGTVAGPSNSVACYGCFKLAEADETYEHRQMPSKVISTELDVLLFEMHDDRSRQTTCHLRAVLQSVPETYWSAMPARRQMGLQREVQRENEGSEISS